MAGLTCIFPTRTQTQWELDNCPHVELTSDLEWNPNGVHFGYDVADVGSDDLVAISTNDMRHCQPDIDPATLSKHVVGNRFGNSLQHHSCNNALHPINCRYHTDYMSLHHH